MVKRYKPDYEKIMAINQALIVRIGIYVLM